MHNSTCVLSVHICFLSRHQVQRKRKWSQPCPKQRYISSLWLLKKKTVLLILCWNYPAVKFSSAPCTQPLCSQNSISQKYEILIPYRCSLSCYIRTWLISGPERGLSVAGISHKSTPPLHLQISSTADVLKATRRKHLLIGLGWGGGCKSNFPLVQYVKSQTYCNLWHIRE